MFGNNSPWIAQLNRTRPLKPLEENLIVNEEVIKADEVIERPEVPGDPNPPTIDHNGS